jgi:hypothetical protein
MLLAPQPKPGTWDRLKSLVLDGLTSAHSRRAYGQALDHFSCLVRRGRLASVQ